MAVQLVEQAASDKFEPAKYEDTVKARIQDQIQRKVEGEEITEEPTEAPKTQIIDLMEALKASLAKGKGSTGGERKPAKRAQRAAEAKPARRRKAARPPAAKIRGSLRRLKQQLPRGRALSELRITAEGHRVVARDGALAWNPDSGQLVLDFDVASLAERAAPLARRQAAAARRVQDDLDAEQWFDLGLELEVSAPEDARDAYRRALQPGPPPARARADLGRLLVGSGRAEEAEEHFRARSGERRGGEEGRSRGGADQ